MYHPDLINAFLLLTFLVLVSTSTKCLHFLKCHEFVELDDPKYYLYKDYSIDCESSRYKGGVVFAVLGILLYTVGVPLMYALLLWKHRAILGDADATEAEEAAKSPSTGHLKFLTQSYSAGYFWFEVVECVRRLLLGAVVGILAEDSAANAVAGLVLCILFTWVFVKHGPFREEEDNRMGVVLMYSLTFIFLGALMTKTDISGDDGDDQVMFGAFLTGIFFMGPAAAVYQLARAVYFQGPLALAALSGGAAAAQALAPSSKQETATFSAAATPTDAAEPSRLPKESPPLNFSAALGSRI